MRNIFTLFFVCFSSVLLAQRPGGQNPSSIKVPDSAQFKAEKMAGIHNYDIDKILKKLKIKKADSTALPVKAALTNFNEKLAQIGLINKDLFEGLDVVVSMNIKTAVKYKNRETIMSTMKMAIEKLEPIVLEVKQKEKELNETLEKVLPTSKFDKWKKYQKAEREKRLPKIGERTNGNRRRPNGKGPR